MWFPKGNFSVHITSLKIILPFNPAILVIRIHLRKQSEGQRLHQNFIIKLLFFIYKILFIFRERGGEEQRKERNINVKKKQ